LLVEKGGVSQTYRRFAMPRTPVTQSKAYIPVATRPWSGCGKHLPSAIPC